MRTIRAVFISAATFLATVASAADLKPVYKAPPIVGAPAYSWSGFYVGGNLGYGWGSNTGASWDAFNDPGPVLRAGFGPYFTAGGNQLPGTKLTCH